MADSRRSIWRAGRSRRFFPQHRLGRARAIGYLDADGIVAEFDPSAIFDRAWRIRSIRIDHADFELRTPNDALKRQMPPKKPRPWYLFFAPDRFECGPIVCPHTNLFYTFQDKDAQIRDAHVQADLIGKGPEIHRHIGYARNAVAAESPHRPARTAGDTTRDHRLHRAVLGLNPSDTTRLALSGRMGMREDKSIDVEGSFTDLPLDQVLPDELHSLVQGTASGHLTWKRDHTGKLVDSDGELTLTGAHIERLSVFSQVKLLNDNPSLDSFTFTEATCQFHIHGGKATLNLSAKCPGKFTLNGTVVYEKATKLADLDLTVTDLPLVTWLPTEFKPRYEGSGERPCGVARTARHGPGIVGHDGDQSRRRADHQAGDSAPAAVIEGHAGAG